MQLTRRRQDLTECLSADWREPLRAGHKAAKYAAANDNQHQPSRRPCSQGLTHQRRLFWSQSLQTNSTETAKPTCARCTPYGTTRSKARRSRRTLFISCRQGRTHKVQTSLKNVGALLAIKLRPPPDAMYTVKVAQDALLRLRTYGVEVRSVTAKVSYRAEPGTRPAE